MSVPSEQKARENRLRRAAAVQGFALRKARRRDRRALDYGQYWLLRLWELDLLPGVAALEDPEIREDWRGPFASLDDLEAWLAQDPEERPVMADGHPEGPDWLTVRVKAARWRS